MRDRHRQKNPKNRKTKVHLVFDEESRKDFLTGFHRRKLDRKKFHQKRLAEQHKEAVRQMRRERKKALEESVNLQFPDDKLEKELLSENQEVHDLPDHTVTVTSVTDLDLSSTPGGLGPPELEYESDENEETTNKEATENDDDDFGFSLTHREVEIEKETPEIPDEQTKNISQKRKKMLRKQKSNKKKPKKAGIPSKLHQRKRKRLATSRKHINYMKKR